MGRAARGLNGRRYPWGEEIDSDRANYSDAEIGSTSPVGAFPRGATPENEGSAHDLSGNVFEWMRSLWKDYPYDPEDGREDMKAQAGRVVRGGSFYHGDRSVRAALRDHDDPGYRNFSLGFRVVVSRF